MLKVIRKGWVFHRRDFVDLHLSRKVLHNGLDLSRPHYDDHWLTHKYLLKNIIFHNMIRIAHFFNLIPLMDSILWIYAREKREKQFSIKDFLLLYLARNGPAVLENVLAPWISQLSKRHRLGWFPFSTIKFRRFSKISLYSQGLSASKADAICCLKQSALFQDSATVMFI